MNDSSKEFCKLQYQISNIVNSRYRGVDWLAVAGNICVCYLNPPPLTIQTVAKQVVIIGFSRFHGIWVSKHFVKNPF
jgi:hypothetical protein